MLGRSAAEVIPNTRLPIVLKQGEPELNQEQNLKKMLRVLQEKEIMKVGSTTTVPVDVRVIAATNANLEQKVRESRFREDLYYRLNVVPLPIPPLRSIREDIPLIARQETAPEKIRPRTRGSTSFAIKSPSPTTRSSRRITTILRSGPLPTA